MLLRELKVKATMATMNTTGKALITTIIALAMGAIQEAASAGEGYSVGQARRAAKRVFLSIKAVAGISLASPDAIRVMGRVAGRGVALVEAFELLAKAHKASWEAFGPAGQEAPGSLHMEAALLVLDGLKALPAALGRLSAGIDDAKIPEVMEAACVAVLCGVAAKGAQHPEWAAELQDEEGVTLNLLTNNVAKVLEVMYNYI